MPSGIYIRKLKPKIFKCKCGENNPKKFYKGYKNICNKCVQNNRRAKLPIKFKCGKCGETKKEKFYPYISYRCKECHYNLTKAWKNPGTRHEIYIRRKEKGITLKEAKRSRDKNRDLINKRQQLKRTYLEQRLKDRLDCDSRRTIGVSTKNLSTREMKILLYIRLFKIIRSGNSINASQTIKEFELKPFEILLSTYQYKVSPNQLKLEGI